jgi:transposase InsO family protein
MKKSKYSESQIVHVLKEAEAGVPLEDLIRKHGFSAASFYKWKAKYSGMSVSDLKRMREAERQPRWGCRKMSDYLRNQGHRWNHKRIHPIDRALALHLHRKPKKRLAPRTAQTLAVPAQPNQVWSLDFMSDSLANGRAIRTLNIVDDFNREALWIEIDTSLPAARVIRVLENLMLLRPTPHTLRMDNGPEWISKRLAEWAQAKQIELRHIQPGKPAQNAYIERPHDALRGLSPREYATQNA